jgi:endonuclease/exonuclease/phosphatase family metal-dependent hydrolase
MWGFRIALLMGLCWRGGAAEFSVATYNVRNYLVRPVPGRKAKSETARKRVVDVLARLKADVVALQEIGGRDALNDLRYRVRGRGVDYPFYNVMPARDGAINIALLSRFPIVSLRAHTNDQFLVEGARQWVGRGILEAEIAVDGGYRFTLLVAHLKSKRAVPYALETELRKREAIVLRRRVEAILEVRPEANLLVAGDLNDEPESTAVRIVKGRGQRALTDLSPPVRVLGARETGPPGNWTHHYRREQEHQRLDYVLAGSGMARELLPEACFTADPPGWFEASDHRPVVARFVAEDR